MGAQPNYVIPLAEVSDRHEPLIGAKAARLAALARVETQGQAMRETQGHKENKDRQCVALRFH